MALSAYRRVEVALDLANDYAPPVTVSSEDSGGRVIRAVITDGGAAVAPTGLTARLLYNPAPGDGSESGGYVIMAAVAGEATATFEAACPRIEPPSGLMAVEVSDAAGTVVSRTFEARVERPVLAMERQSGQDALAEFRAAVKTLGDVTAATKAANTAAKSAETQAAAAKGAASSATSAASSANTAASGANSAKDTATKAATAANTAAGSANTAASAANTAASNANGKATAANTAATAANTAATKANEATAKVTTALASLGVPVYIVDKGATSALPSGARTPCVLVGRDNTIYIEDGTKSAEEDIDSDMAVHPVEDEPEGEEVEHG